MAEVSNAAVSQITGVQVQPHGPTRVQLLKDTVSQDYWCPDTAAWSNQGATPYRGSVTRFLGSRYSRMVQPGCSSLKRQSHKITGVRYSRMVQPGCRSLQRQCHKISGVQIQPPCPTRMQLEAMLQDYFLFLIQTNIGS